MVSVSIDTAKLDALFAPCASNDRPGIAVGIAHQGVPVYRRGFGLASVELPEPLSPTIRMRIGSTSKHFTCLCIMLLAEEGKLSPEDSVRKHLPELKAWADGITLAGLMSHISGTRCSLDILVATQNVMEAGNPLPHHEQFALLADIETTNFPIGTRWNYSNGGYVLLTKVIARLSGMRYEDFLQQRVLTPVGMLDSFARPTESDWIANCAALHLPDPAGGFSCSKFGPEIGGEGSIVATVDDMLTWLRHMSAPTVGCAESWRQMRTPALLKDGTNTHYGFGLMLRPYRGANVIAHSGGVLGGASQMLKVVDHDLDIVILTNHAGIDPAALTNQVIDICITDLDSDYKASNGILGAFPTGDFFGFDTHRHARIVDKDGQPFLNLMSAEMPLTLQDDGSLSFMDLLILKPVEGGLDVTMTDTTEHLVALEKPDDNRFAAIAGDWHSNEIGVTLNIADNGRMRTAGKYGSANYALEAIGPHIWSAIHPMRGGSATLQHADGDLFLSSPRSVKMRFSRT